MQSSREPTKCLYEKKKWGLEMLWARRRNLRANGSSLGHCAAESALGLNELEDGNGELAQIFMVPVYE